MSEDIFKKSRDCISEGLIRKLFDCKKSETIKSKRELKTLNPYRSDKNIGSFFINLDTGLWRDFATQEDGDLIDLICKTFNLNKLEAAEKIIKETGGIVPEKKEKKKEKKKNKAVIPIPEEKLKLLNKHVKNKFITEKFGKASNGWICRDKEGKAWMCVTRHIKDKSKNDVPYHFCEDGKWHAGCQVQKNRPLYNIEKVKKDSKLVIVEGYKCADVKVPGYVLLSWWGGGGQIDKYDWKEIKNHDVTVWPDLDYKEGLEIEDQPGLKNALWLKSILKQSKILDVYKKYGTAKPDGWDIYDAKEEKVDLIKFIKECEYYVKISDRKTDIESNERTTEKSEISNAGSSENLIPFKFLGFDEARHYFLPKGSNIVKRFNFGAFSRSKLFELASINYWELEYPQKKGFDFDTAVSDLIRESESIGYFKPDIIRGAGVWEDSGKIVVNNGKTISDNDGNVLNNFKSKYFYVISDKDMGNFSGRVNNSDEGYKLMELFLAQGFETDFEALITLGWSLIAPFGGILKWRPHIWLTGPKSSGKSWIMENLIYPICGPFAFTGSGSDSAAGLYRSLWKDPCPVIKDEMEPGTSKETRRKIDETLEVVRNASSDFSAYKTLANQAGGVDRFCIRSCFCLSSIVPYMQGEAIESRILVCRIKNSALAQSKYDRTKDILKSGLMDDPGIFRRQIFKNIKYLLQNIDIIKKILLSETGDQRKADNMAPIFAGLYNLIKPGKIDHKKNIKKFIKDSIHAMEKTDGQSDEDLLLREIFDFNIRTTPSDVISIAELILKCEKSRGSSDEETLLRHGIKIYMKEGEKYLAIATHHSQIKFILRETMYATRYVSVLERHEAALPKIKNHIQVRFAGQKKYAVHLIWDKIKKLYFGEPEKEVEEQTDFTHIF